MFMFNKSKSKEEAPRDVARQNNAMSLSTLGIIASIEGSLTLPPPIDPSLIQNDRYIPLQYAENKLRELHNDRLAIKEVYEKRLQTLTQIYEKNLKNTKEHYEIFIMEVKSKAEKHIELQKSLRKSLEDKLTAELQEKNTIIEELRDNAASVNITHQDDVRALKSSFKEVETRCEGMAKSLQDIEVDRECLLVLSDLISRIDNEGNSQQLSVLHDELTLCKSQYNDLKLRYDEETGRYSKEILILQEDLLAYRECSSILTRLAGDIEISDQVSLKEQYQRKICELNAKLDELVVVSASRTVVDDLFMQAATALNDNNHMIESQKLSSASALKNESYQSRIEVSDLLQRICQRIEVDEWKQLNTSATQKVPDHPSFEYELLFMKIQDLESRMMEKELLLSKANQSITKLESLKRHLSRSKLSNSKIETNDVEAAPVSSSNAPLEPPIEVLHNPDDLAFIEQLEDKLAEYKDSIATLKESNKRLEDDKQFIQHQLDNMTKEKRTDLVKRLEEEIEAFKKLSATQAADLIYLRTEKQKALTRNKELQDRVNAAEKEIKDRDAVELAKLNERDEKHQLKTQIVKQRDEIVMKAKAATAGWDAAASSDGRLDNEVEKAYQRGIAEGRQQHNDDMLSLNLAIEKKEERLTELVVQLNSFEAKVREAELAAVKYRQEMEDAKQETADTVLMFTQFNEARRGKLTTTETKESVDLQAEGSRLAGGEEDEPAIGPSSKEYESLKEILDQSQEEVLELADKVDTLQEKLNLCEQRTNVMEQLLVVERHRHNQYIEKMSTKKTSSQTNSSNLPNQSNGAANKELQEIATILKASLVRGGALWKSNKKDECYDLYAQMNSTAMNKLANYLDYKKLFAEAAGSAKAMVTGKSNQKAKAAMVLKKAVEKFLLIVESRLVSLCVITDSYS
jgi:hypothetical protein